jgi:hypothetical protein
VKYQPFRFLEWEIIKWAAAWLAGL